VKREPIGSVIKGVDKLFITDNSELGITKSNTQGSKEGTIQGSEEHTPQDNIQDNKQDNKQGSIQDTTQYTNKYTVGMPEKTELVCERLVANVTKAQKKYVKDMAKKFENESAFVRFMLDYFIQNIEIK
jgi:hypothetical protein